MKLKVIVMLLWALFVFALVCGQAAAPTQFTVDGSTTYEQVRIIRLERSLNFTQQAMTDDWSITIWPQDRFEKYVRDNKIDTPIAFTFLDTEHTYINEYFLVWVSDEDVRFVLAHEAGHMICECRSELKADAIADVMTGVTRSEFEATRPRW